MDNDGYPDEIDWAPADYRNGQITMTTEKETTQTPMMIMTAGQIPMNFEKGQILFQCKSTNRFV